MRKIFVVFVPFFTLLTVSGCAVFLPSVHKEPIQTRMMYVSHAPQIRVLSYNIHYGVGTDGKFDIRRIANVINATNPDIVALQEVERKRFRTLFVDQAEKLERLTGLRVVFSSNMTFFGGGEYGNAILTRFPIFKYENYSLPRLGGSQRGMLKAEILISPLHGDFNDLPLPLYVFNTHLEAGKKKKDILERMASANFINDLVKPLIGKPMIFMGDFNALPESQVMDLLRTTWAIAGDGEDVYTYSAPSPYKQIDYILLHPKDKWEVVDIQVIDEAVASDHRPILVVLKWRGK